MRVRVALKVVSPHFWPAEWERQSATWIAWPHNSHTWPGRFAAIPSVFQKLIDILSQVQPVHVLTSSRCSKAPIEDYLEDASNVVIHEIATNDAWIRDFGPTFVRRVDDGSIVGIDWQYNAWGGKYPPFDDDAKASESICRILACPRSVSSLYCEGGALEGNGAGVVMTTGSCLLSPSRNPGWTRKMVEDELRLQLGANRILWVDGGGLQGDDTDGHIDQIARFVREDVIVAATSSEASDPNSEGLQQNVKLLQQAVTTSGSPYEVVALPTPPPRFIDSQRVPESYCNFVLANGLVVVPTYRNDQSDTQAVELLTQLFPNHKIVPLDAYDLVWGLGAFHCCSQQLPALDEPQGNSQLENAARLLEAD